VSIRINFRVYVDIFFLFFHWRHRLNLEIFRMSIVTWSSVVYTEVWLC